MRTSVSSPAESLGGTGEDAASDRTGATVPFPCPPAAEEEAEAWGGAPRALVFLERLKGIETFPCFLPLVFVRVEWPSCPGGEEGLENPLCWHQATAAAEGQPEAPPREPPGSPGPPSGSHGSGSPAP